MLNLVLLPPLWLSASLVVGADGRGKEEVGKLEEEEKEEGREEEGKE